MNIGIEYDYEGYMLTTEWDGLISESSRVHAFFGLVFSVAYLECANGGGPGGLGDGSPPVGSRGKAPVGGPPEADAFCY